MHPNMNTLNLGNCVINEYNHRPVCQANIEYRSIAQGNDYHDNSKNQ